MVFDESARTMVARLPLALVTLSHEWLIKTKTSAADSDCTIKTSAAEGRDLQLKLISNRSLLSTNTQQQLSHHYNMKVSIVLLTIAFSIRTKNAHAQCVAAGNSLDNCLETNGFNDAQEAACDMCVDQVEGTLIQSANPCDANAACAALAACPCGDACDAEVEAYLTCELNAEINEDFPALSACPALACSMATTPVDVPVAMPGPSKAPVVSSPGESPAPVSPAPVAGGSTAPITPAPVTGGSPAPATSAPVRAPTSNGSCVGIWCGLSILTSILCILTLGIVC